MWAWISRTPFASGSPGLPSYKSMPCFKKMARVTPALPAGLVLDGATGAVAGTPTALSPAAMYVVTAANDGGSTSATVSVTVNDVAPANLAYSRNPATYTKGTAITSNTPSSTGGTVVSYAVNPPLPAGLSLSPSTGVITGTPTMLRSPGV